MTQANSYSVKSDQFDIRLNVKDQAHVDEICEKMKVLCDGGTVRYLHVSGMEVGDVPGRTSFGVNHIHIALVLFNFTSKRSIVSKFTNGINGFYIEPRDKSKPLSGWIEYHSKSRTKCNPDDTLIFVFGILPNDGNRCKRKNPTDMTEREKIVHKKKADDWARKKYLMVMSMWDEMDQEFPGFIYSSMGQSMKREVQKQANDDYTKPLDGNLSNFIIWGGSGTGKSSSVSLLYPNCYKKQKGSQYWDAYDKTNPDHSVVWIDEMSKETLKTFSGKMDGGFEFLKELGDRYAVTVDEKYTKGYKIRPKTIIITMNEHPTTLLPERAVEVNKQALYRKFKIMHVEVSNAKCKNLNFKNVQLTNSYWLGLVGSKWNEIDYFRL